MLIGDSQLRRLDTEKLSNDHHSVGINAKPGLKIQQVAQTVGKTDRNIIIVHTGTNNILKSTPEELCDSTMTALKKIQQSNPNAQIAFSSVFRRKEENGKVQKFNKLIEEELSLNGFDYVDNSNILFSNLWTDGLHINDGGIRKYAGNVSKYIRYC